MSCRVSQSGLARGIPVVVLACSSASSLPVNRLLVLETGDFISLVFDFVIPWLLMWCFSWKAHGIWLFLHNTSGHQSAFISWFIMGCKIVIFRIIIISPVFVSWDTCTDMKRNFSRHIFGYPEVQFVQKGKMLIFVLVTY